MKTALAALFLLALVPASAAADSEYRQCMKMDNLPGGSSGMFVPGRYSGLGSSYLMSASSRYFPGPGSYSTRGFYDYNSMALGGVGFGFALSSQWSFAQNSRVLNRTYACRHLIKVKPPAYRVTGVKSPTNRTSTNVTGRKATPRPPRGFLPPGN